MSLRLKKLIELSMMQQKPYTNWFAKLKSNDWAEMLKFLVDHDHLNVDQFQYQLNRYFLEFELKFKRPRPKNFLNIDEILGNCNTYKTLGEK